MSIIQYDPDEWLVSLTRSLKSFVEDNVDPLLVNVEMSYPDTRDWTKQTPLDKTLIHFEVDDQAHPVWAFGNPGKEVFTESPDAGVTSGMWRVDEAQKHHVNFDVGVWASAESGGATARMTYHQLLTNLFAVAGAKQFMQDATGGIWVVSFTGGRYATDRINDLPIWRALDITLIAEVFSRHTPETEEVVADEFLQDQELSIADNTGAQVPVE